MIARIVAVVDTYDAMTARDSYREPRSSFEAIAELRRVAGTQLDAELVELFVEMLADKTLAYRHGEDADFEAELALDKRIHDYVAQTDVGTSAERVARTAGHTERPCAGACTYDVEGRRVERLPFGCSAATRAHVAVPRFESLGREANDDSLFRTCAKLSTTCANLQELA